MDEEFAQVIVRAIKKLTPLEIVVAVCLFLVTITASSGDKISTLLAPPSKITK